MNRLSKLFGLGVSVFIIISCWLYAGDSFLLRIQVYDGKTREDASSVLAESLLRASQEPRLTFLCETAGAGDDEWSANVVKALFDLGELETVNELFRVARTWDGRPKDWFDRFLGTDSVFRLEFSAKRSPDKRVDFRLVVFRSKPGLIRPGESLETKVRRALEARTDPKKMDKIVETEFALDLEDPVIIRPLWNGGALFVVISLVKNVNQAALADSKARIATDLEVVSPPRSIKEIEPYYPETLRRRRIEGEVRAVVAIDKSGKVMSARVIQSVHPYLDYSVVQALLGGQYEPVLKNGKAVEAVFPYVHRFEVKSGQSQEPAGQVRAEKTLASAKLDEILAGSAAYCRLLAGTITDFVCEETISEIDYKLRPNAQRVVDYVRKYTSDSSNMGREIGSVTARLSLMDPVLTSMTRYVCDYQIVRDRDLIKERRILIKRGGRKVPDGMVLEEKRYSLMPILAGVKILSAERQGLFIFRLAAGGKVQGRECDIVEALPKDGNVEGIESARMWIGKEDRRILRCEIEGVPIEGFEEVLADCVQLSVHPRFIATYDYGTNHGAVSLPSRTAILIEYPVPKFMSAMGSEVKANIDMKYSKYRYFSVKTEHDIIK